jgi:hypothetical protein
MRIVRFALLLLLACGAARADDDGDALTRLAREMGDGRPRAAAMDLYARAFAGYALVDRGLAFPVERAQNAALLDRLIAQVLDAKTSQPFHCGMVTVAGHRLSMSAALRGHLALLLVGRARLVPLDADRRALLDALARGLASHLTDKPTHLLPSYGDRVWPADNEVIATALALYLDRLDGDRAVVPGLRALQRSLADLERDGLPPSEIEPRRLRGREVPRGCALSWTVAMRAQHDRAGARRLYDAYRARFFVDWGALVGFREWPPGVDRPADSDSGPIVLGIGVAASGIGLGAARLAGATDDEGRLRATSIGAGMPLIERTPGRDGWTPRAMALWGRGARPW